VEPESRDVHIFDDLSRIQRGQLHPLPFGMLRLDSSQGSRFE
jgi:hypothetical protein